jgi:hypothetical protein
MDSDIFEKNHPEEETLGFLQSYLEIDLDRIRLVIARRCLKQWVDIKLPIKYFGSLIFR